MDLVSQNLLMTSGGKTDPTYIDDVFSTYVRTYTGATATITNGIDFSKGGLVWAKNRTQNYNHVLIDTVRGGNKVVKSNANTGEETASDLITAFNNNGYTVGADASFGSLNNSTTDKGVHWSFRKARGFFDVVTYTGTGSVRTISHSLGSVPGCIMIKGTSNVNSWYVYHRNVGAEKYLRLNASDAETDQSWFMNDTEPTSSEFSLGTSSNVNGSGQTYVAYIFAGGESTAATARSVDFDGNDKLIIPATSDLSLNTNDFTFEAWVYPTNYGEIVGAFNATPNYKGWLFSLDFGGNTGKMAIWLSDGSTYGTYHSNSVVPLGHWSHVAFTKSGTNYTFYLNGVNDGSFTSSKTPLDSEQDIYIAADTNPSSSRYLTGKISNLRITRQVLYTTSFRPSTEPLTTTSQGATASNVKLLCCNNSSATGSTVTPSTISSGGDPTASTDSSFDDPAGFKFGEEGDQNIIKCGSFTGNGSATGPDVYLGFEPQWLLIKNSEKSENWLMFDSMRGIVTDGNDARLFANASTADSSPGDFINLTPTGFQINDNGGDLNEPNDQIIYIAIRRPDGLVGKPAEAGTDVFGLATGRTDNVKPTFTTGFPVDLNLYRPVTTSSWVTGARLIGRSILYTDSSGSEQTTSSYEWNFNNGMGNWTGNQSAYKSWNWKRHAGFDVVAWNGDGVSGRQMPHSMGKTPEMIWVKRRNSNDDWTVYHYGQNGGINPEQYRLRLNEQVMNYTGTSYWNNTAPTSTHFTLGNDGTVNSGGTTLYIGFLFASVDGISKVGYYDGQNSELTITTGFQPRFVILKRVSAQSDWHVLDTARGWGAGDDNYLALNSTQAQAPHNIGAPTSTGFTLTVTAEYNGAGGKYIYYAHA